MIGRHNFGCVAEVAFFEMRITKTNNLLRRGLQSLHAMYLFPNLIPAEEPTIASHSGNALRYCIICARIPMCCTRQLERITPCLRPMDGQKANHATNLWRSLCHSGLYFGFILSRLLPRYGAGASGNTLRNVQVKFKHLLYFSCYDRGIE